MNSEALRMIKSLQLRVRKACNDCDVLGFKLFLKALEEDLNKVAAKLCMEVK